MSNRKIRNFLLKPNIQIRIGLYTVATSLIFAVLIGMIFHMQFSTLYVTVLELTDIQEEVSEVINQQITDSFFWLVFISAAFICTNIVLAIWYTHRMVGPSVAFKRHIDNLIRGDYLHKTTLRRGDAFQDVALRLNTLSNTLKNRYDNPEADLGRDESA